MQLPTSYRKVLEVANEIPLDNCVLAAEKKRAIQAEIEIAATRFRKVSASVASTAPVATHRIIDALAPRLHGLEPVV
jgi:hypothetical protein